MSTKQSVTHIITGQWRGQKLLLPQNAAVRPTRNMVVQAGFNLLESRLNFKNLQLADLCCGSGQWGLEALSRGAAHVHFVDTDLTTLRHNMVHLQAPVSQATLHQTPLEKISAFPQPQDLIIADPPYQSALYHTILNAPQWGKSGTLWLLETAKNATLGTPQYLTLEKHKTYGNSELWLFSQQ